MKKRCHALEDTDEDAERVFGVNKNIWSLQRNSYLASCLCLQHHPSPEHYRHVVLLGSLVHVWKADSNFKRELHPKLYRVKKISFG